MKFLQKIEPWINPFMLIFETVFSTLFFCQGEICLGILTALVGITYFVNIFIMPKILDKKK